MDIASITGALTSVKTILDIAKTIEDQRVSIAINSAVADIQVKLILTQQQILEIQDENLRLKDENRRLKEQSELEASVSFHDGAYWRKTDGKEEGPFCPRCWGLNKKLILPMIDNSIGDPISLVCTDHKSAHYFQVPAKLAKHLKGGRWES